MADKHRWYDFDSSSSDDEELENRRFSALRKENFPPDDSPGSLGSPSAVMHRRANLTKSRELLLVARNAREHSREKDALRLRLQAALEKNELVEEDLKTEKQRVRLAEQRTRLAEDETRIVKEELTKFKASTAKALQEREHSLQEMSHSVSGKAEYAEQQLARLQAELATAKAERLSAIEEKESAARELEKIRTIEEQTSGVAADLMQRCNTLRSQLSAAERHSETLEKELNDALGGNNAEIANGALENLEQLLEEAASASSGDLIGVLTAAHGELGAVRESVTGLLLECATRTPCRPGGAAFDTDALPVSPTIASLAKKSPQSPAPGAWRLESGKHSPDSPLDHA